MTSQEQTNNASGNQSVKGGRIVAGIDGSPVSLMALEWAARQAEYTDSSLEVVAAWSGPPVSVVVHSRWLRSRA